MYWCFYIVKAVDGMRVWRAEVRVCPLQCRLSLTLSVVIAVRQTVIILGRAPLGGKTRGGRRIMDALVFALSCFSSCLCRHPFLLTTLRSLVKTPLYLHWMTQPHYLRLSPFPSLSFSKLDLKKIKKFKRHSPQIWWFNNSIDFSRLETSDSAAGSRVNSQSAAPLSFLSPDTCDWCPRP